MPLKDYKFVKQIGKGGFGEALLYVHKDKKEYVIKKMDMNDPDVKAVADSECDKMSQLNHEHIVAYRECFVESGYMYLIMEYCQGGDLAEEIKAARLKAKFFDEVQILQWTFQICLGLEYLHDNNTIHRDLKPQNIFLSDKKQIRIGDFGIARTLKPGDLATTVIGTPIYLSPELIAQHPYDNKIDVWALGCCVYEMMTFHTAVDPTILLALQKWVIGAMPTNYSHELTTLTDDMLTIDADKRPTVKLLLQDNLMTKLQQNRKDAACKAPTRQSVALQELANNGLTFNNNGQLVDSITGRLFEYKVFPDDVANEKRYQAVAVSVTKYVQEVIEHELKLVKISIPTGAKSNDAQSYIYATPDWKSNKKQLLVLIQGMGAPRAGEWSRSAIINDCMDAGSQVPWVTRGVTDGYAVMLLNPNFNSETISGKEVKVRGSESSADHIKYVWENFITKASAKNIFFVAHSSGGDNLVELACDKVSPFVSKVTAVAFTDSVHKVTKQMPPKLTKFLYEHCQHWVASTHDLDVPILFETFDAPQVSAGDLRHEWTSWSSFNSVFEFFKTKMK